MPIRAVVFDLFITLTDWNAERRRPAFTAALATAFGADTVAFSSVMRETFTERVTGQLGDARSTFATLAHRLGRDLDCDTLDALLALRYEQARYLLTPRADALEAIVDLRAAGYAIGVLTDCTAETPELWPSLPYASVVDAVSFSCIVGARKPNPAGYHDIAGRLGVAPDECLYVGDGSSSELSGALATGMTPVLLETPFGTDFRYDAQEGWSGPSLTELDQLKPLLLDL